MRSSRPGRERRLTLRPLSADKGDMVAARALRSERRFGARVGERGQAMVELAIVMPVIVLLIAGIIQFGIALNWWLDMQRIANQGARWAAVNSYPGCPRTPAGVCNSPRLQTYLALQEISGGLDPCVEVSFPDPDGAGPGIGEPKAGNPVEVTLKDVDFNLVPLFGYGVSLTAHATMRQEWKATQYTLGSYDGTGSTC